MSEFGDTIPYTVGNNTIDLSASWKSSSMIRCQMIP